MPNRTPDHRPDAGPDLVAVLETGDATLLTVAKSVLEDAGIPFMVQGEYALAMLPLGAYGASLRKHGVAAIMHVAREDAERAKALLSSLPAADADEGA